MKNSKAVRLVALAYDEGRSEGYRETVQEEQDQYLKGWNLAHEMLRQKNDEALAQAKSQAYEAGYAQAQEEAHKVGYQRGLAEGQARAVVQDSLYQSGYAQGVSDGKLEEEARAKAYEPKLSVWFKPCGPSPKPPEASFPSRNKIDALKAIRQAYDKAEGYSLKETKDLIEIEPGTRVVCGLPLPQSKAVTLYLALSAAGFDPVLKG